MKRIIIHHTAGAYKPNSTDLKAYHFLVDNLGTVHSGVYKPEDNENCKDGKYAAHTYLGNTGSIGVAACCNYGFNLKHKQSLYPFTPKQFNTICKLCVYLSCKYDIRISNIYTHYGFDKSKGIYQGKIDITYLPWKPDLNPDEVQNYFRQEIRKLL